jgi:hypothetical protein
MRSLLKSAMVAGAMTLGSGAIAGCDKNTADCTNVFVQGPREADGDLALVEGELQENPDFNTLEVCAGVATNVLLVLKESRDIRFSVGSNDGEVSRLLVEELEPIIGNYTGGEVRIPIACVTEPEEGLVSVPEGNLELRFTLTEKCPEGF